MSNETTVEHTFSADAERTLTDAECAAVEDGHLYSAIDAHLTSSVAGVHRIDATCYGDGAYVALHVTADSRTAPGAIMDAWREVMRWNRVPLAGIEHNDTRDAPAMNPRYTNNELEGIWTDLNN